MRLVVTLLALLPLATASLAAPAAARPCATLELREAVRAGQGAHLATQERPASLGYVDSDAYPIRVHWELAQFEERAPAVLAELEEAWALLVDEQGWPAPPPDDGEGGDDRFDAYVGGVAPAGAITVAHEDTDPEDGRHASYSYIHFSGLLTDEQLPVFVHHELAHVMQFAVDLSASFMFAEASAVAQERFALPELSSWTDSLADFQAYPQAPIFTNGVDWAPIAGDDTLYEFGAALFLLYLEQEHGDLDGTLIRELWEASVQPDDVEENEPDWLDALSEEVAPAEELVLDFATWRVLLASWAVPGDGLAGGGQLSNAYLPSTKQLLPGALDGTPLQVGLAEKPHQHGCLPLEVRALSEDLPIALRAASVGEDERALGVAWLIGKPDENRARRGVHGNIAPVLTLRLTIPANEIAILAVCDLGEADADELPEGAEVDIRVWRSDGDPPVLDAGPYPDVDAGSEPDGGPPPPTCGCQAVPSRGGGAARGPFAELRPYALVAGTLIGLTIFGLRFARVRKRRKLYKKDASRARE